MDNLNAKLKTRGEQPLLIKRKILLVDDDPADLRFYGLILEHEGYGVRSTASFEEGARLLGQQSFDMVVVSQGSRGFEGRSVLERANQDDRRTPVVVLARNLDPRYYLEAIELGAVDYREKTTDAPEFIWVIETHLRFVPPELEQNGSPNPC